MSGGGERETGSKREIERRERKMKREMNPEKEGKKGEERHESWKVGGMKGEERHRY